MPERPPRWERDEIELVLAHGHKSNWPPSLSEDDPDVIRLSRILRDHRNIAAGDLSNKTRNPAGVVRNYADLYSQIPGRTSSPTNGGRLTREIMQGILTTLKNFPIFNLDKH